MFDGISERNELRYFLVMAAGGRNKKGKKTLFFFHANSRERDIAFECPRKKLAFYFAPKDLPINIFHFIARVGTTEALLPRLIRTNPESPRPRYEIKMETWEDIKEIVFANAASKDTILGGKTTIFSLPVFFARIKQGFGSQKNAIRFQTACPKAFREKCLEFGLPDAVIAPLLFLSLDGKNPYSCMNQFGGCGQCCAKEIITI